MVCTSPRLDIDVSGRWLLLRWPHLWFVNASLGRSEHNKPHIEQDSNKLRNIFFFQRTFEHLMVCTSSSQLDTDVSDRWLLLRWPHLWFVNASLGRSEHNKLCWTKLTAIDRWWPHINFGCACAYACACARMCVCTHVHVRACACVCSCAYECVWMCVSACRVCLCAWGVCLRVHVPVRVRV